MKIDKEQNEETFKIEKKNAWKLWILYEAYIGCIIILDCACACRCSFLLWLCAHTVPEAL